MEDRGGSAMARRTVLGLFVGGAAAMLAGCNGKASYRFRMTVEIKTPQGLRSGSSVYEVLAEKNNTKLLAEERAGGTITRGEALVVELPDSPIFVLLQMAQPGNGLGAVATLALAPATPGGDIDAYISAVSRLGGMFGGAKAELSPSNWPMMVRFRNLNDPTSIELVDPKTIGVKRIVVETTGDPITTGIEKRLPWLPNIYRMGIGPDFRPTGIPLGNFKRLFSTQLDT